MAPSDRPTRERNPDLPVWIYRGAVGVLLMALLAVMGFTGGRIMSSIDSMAVDVSSVREKLVRFEVRMDALEQRMQRVEAESDGRWRQPQDTPAGGR